MRNLREAKRAAASAAVEKGSRQMHAEGSGEMRITDFLEDLKVK